VADERAFRLLTLVDTCTPESPVIEVDVSLGAGKALKGDFPNVAFKFDTVLAASCHIEPCN
jgi:hypothetical protein